MILESDGESLTGLYFTGQRYFGLKDGGYREIDGLEIFRAVKLWLDIYFSGKKPDIVISLKLDGTKFRREVWDILLTIPYGKTVTYGEIAKRLAEKSGAGRMSAQAVGGAVGHNPVSIIVPCHRVIGADGSLTGYAGGIDKKKALLRLEGII